MDELAMQQIHGPVRFRARGFAPRTVPWAAAASLIGLLVLWQTGASLGLIPTMFLPPPIAIGQALVSLSVSGTLWTELAPSLSRLVIGWVLGTAAGVVLGFGVGVTSWLRSPGLAVVSALYPIPKIALVPLFIIWFGIGEGSKIVTIALGVFFPTVLSTAGGIDQVQRGLVRMGQSFGLSRRAIMTKIILPGALPAILNGFRVTSGIAIILLVAAEMIGAQHGIGAFVLQAGNLYDTGNLLAGIVVLSVLGLVVAWVLGQLERVLLRWR